MFNKRNLRTKNNIFFLGNLLRSPRHSRFFTVGFGHDPLLLEELQPISIVEVARKKHMHINLTVNRCTMYVPNTIPIFLLGLVIFHSSFWWLARFLPPTILIIPSMEILWMLIYLLWQHVGQMPKHLVVSS